MARTSGYRLSAVWRPCGVTPHAALQNKSVVCSGSRVTISTVMKLHGSDNRGGIIVKTGKEHLLTYSFIIIIFIIIIINRDLGRKKIAPMRGKTGKCIVLEKDMSWGLIWRSPDRGSVGEKGRSFHVEGPKTEKDWESTVESLLWGIRRLRLRVWEEERRVREGV